MQTSSTERNFKSSSKSKKENQEQEIQFESSISSGIGIESKTESSADNSKNRENDYQSPFFDYQKLETNSNVHKLLDTLSDMNLLVDEIKTLNDNIRQIGHNSAIEASRSDKLLGEFESLTEDIGSMVDRAETANDKLKTMTHHLQLSTMETIGVLLSERSHDVIDKIDRNLFERNCNIQAWASFPENIQCLLEPSPETAKQSSELLQHLCNIYAVYHDIFVLDKTGKIVSAGKHQQFIGHDESESLWFKESLKNNVYVTDMYYCPLVKSHAVGYNYPIKNSRGNVIGVISARFNWKFVNQIIDTASVDPDNEVVVISINGDILSSKNRLAILSESLTWLTAAQISMKGFDGLSSETNRNGQHCIFGSARTRGYSSYKGKDWSVITAQPVFVNDNIRFTKTFKNLNETNEKQSSEYKFMLDLIDRYGQKDQNSEKSLEQIDYGANLQSFDVKNDQEKEISEYIHSDIANLHLKNASLNVKNAISFINQINFDILLMSLNAAVKSERAGQEGKAFSVLSRQIRVISAKSAQATEKLNECLNTLMDCVSKVQQEKIKDAAWDCIDKVDRNLFERNCDIQAWALFESLIKSAEEGRTTEVSNALLGNLHRIYGMYSDIYLLDTSGKVISSAIDRGFIGQSFNDQKWFRAAMDGNSNVTDLYYCKNTRTHTITISSPIRNSRGIVGVLSANLNWEHINEIIDHTISPKGSCLYLLNKEGFVIASTDRNGILEKSFSDTEPFKLASQGEKGLCLIEDEKNEKSYHVSYARTEGYNKYEGKGWICLAYQPVNETDQVLQQEDDLTFN